MLFIIYMYYYNLFGVYDHVIYCTVYHLYYNYHTVLLVQFMYNIICIHFSIHLLIYCFVSHELIYILNINLK